GRLQVHRGHELPFLRRDLGQGALEHDPGVVDRDVHPAEALDDLVHGVRDRRGVAEVGDDPGDGGVSGQFRVECGALDDGDVRPLVEEALDDATTDAATAARDHGDPALQ